MKKEKGIYQKLNTRQVSRQKVGRNQKSRQKIYLFLKIVSPVDAVSLQ